MTRASRQRLAIGAALLACLAVALRVHNAFDYPLGKGFDAEANWEYIELLLEGFQIPAPDSLWAAAHPPLYYWLAAGLGRAVGGEKAAVIVAARLLGSALALGSIALCVLLVRRLHPGDPRRAFLAGALLLFLPVHVYVSAMLNEEIVAAALVSATAVGVVFDLRRDEGSGPWSAAALGALGGLALLTKLSGLLVLGAGALAYALEGRARGELARGALRGAVFGAAGAVVGGWFLARSWLLHGYLYPYQLDVHAVMASMPPGSRSLLDYLRVPLATWRAPVAVSPELLHSVWGTTYASAWFDAHRHFLPRSLPAAALPAQLLTLLGLLPTAAFAASALRGARRLLSGGAGPDALLLPLVGLTLLGYVAFTWRNPWFATLKASYLLGLSVPFAYYASESLAAWTAPGRVRSAVVWLYLALLAGLSVAVFWHGLWFEKLDDPGLRWTPVRPEPFSR